MIRTLEENKKLNKIYKLLTDNEQYEEKLLIMTQIKNNDIDTILDYDLQYFFENVLYDIYEKKKSIIKTEVFFNYIKELINNNIINEEYILKKLLLKLLKPNLSQETKKRDNTFYYKSDLNVANELLKIIKKYKIEINENKWNLLLNEMKSHENYEITHPANIIPLNFIINIYNENPYKLCMNYRRKEILDDTIIVKILSLSKFDNFLSEKNEYNISPLDIILCNKKILSTINKNETLKEKIFSALEKVDSMNEDIVRKIIMLYNEKDRIEKNILHDIINFLSTKEYFINNINKNIINEKYYNNIIYIEKNYLLSNVNSKKNNTNIKKL